MRYILSLLSICFIVACTPVKANVEAKNPKNFNVFKEDLGIQLKSEGLDAALIDRALATADKPIARIIELDQSQPEVKLTFAQYITRVVPQRRIDTGRARFNENKTLLQKVSAEYGVQPEYIVALWGVETDFGRITGGFQIIPALVTLIYDGRRAAFFTKELVQALKIIEGNHIALHDMKGSWAGAMGQTQFMPSSFTAFAQDYDRDGHKDIWGTRADVFASIANYLSKSGWNKDVPVVYKVTTTQSKDQRVTMNEFKPLSYWKSKNIGNLIRLPENTSLKLMQMGEDEPESTYLVTKNFDVLKKWNRSNFFATAAGTLGQAIAAQ